jgi:hypothetical protein
MSSEMPSSVMTPSSEIPSNSASVVSFDYTNITRSPILETPPHSILWYGYIAWLLHFLVSVKVLPQN